MFYWILVFICNLFILYVTDVKLVADFKCACTTICNVWETFLALTSIRLESDLKIATFHFYSQFTTVMSCLNSHWNFDLDSDLKSMFGQCIDIWKIFSREKLKTVGFIRFYRQFELFASTPSAFLPLLEPFYKLYNKENFKNERNFCHSKS